MNGTESAPDSIHGATSWTRLRPPAGSWTRDQTDHADTRNDANIAAQATPPETDFDRRLPTAALTRNPANGSNGTRSSTDPLTTSGS